jgi:type II secretory pathway pseudopilin PulG
MLKMKYIKTLKSRGDTIVEVLIVLAILGMAFAISSATASRGISQSRNAQEHSQGLGVIDTQIEYLRTAIKKQIDLSHPPAAFCFDYSSGNPVITPIPSPDTYSTYPAACKNGSFYTVRISFVGTPPDDGYYDVRVHWDGISNLGPQQEQIAYREHQLTSVDNTNLGLGSEAAQIHVNAKLIQPNVPNTTNGADPGPDPSPPSICNSAGSYSQANKAGPAVTLTGGGQPAQTATLPDSGVTFANLREFSTYTAAVSYSSSSYQLCAPTSKSAQAISGVTNIDFVMRPLCYKENYSYSYTAYGTPYYHTITPVYRDVTTYYGYDGARRSDLDFVGYAPFWGPEFWSPNVNSDGYHYRQGIAAPRSGAGYYWYVAWEWHIGSTTVSVFDHYDYSDYYADSYTVNATGQRWRCPS